MLKKRDQEILEEVMDCIGLVDSKLTEVEKALVPADSRVLLERIKDSRESGDSVSDDDLDSVVGEELSKMSSPRVVVQRHHWRGCEPFTTGNTPRLGDDTDRTHATNDSSVQFEEAPMTIAERLEALRKKLQS